MRRGKEDVEVVVRSMIVNEGDGVVRSSNNDDNDEGDGKGSSNEDDSDEGDGKGSSNEDDSDGGDGKGNSNEGDSE